MTRRDLNPKDFLVGAAIGGVLGTVAALLIAPKTGEHLRHDIYDTCCDVSDKIGKTKKSFTSKAECLSDKASCLVDDIKEWIHPNGHEAPSSKEFIVGGIAGGILGAVAALLLTPKSGSDMRQNLADAYDDVSERTHEMAAQAAKRGKKFAKQARSQANDWLDVLQTVMSTLAERASDKTEDLIERAEESFEEGKLKKVVDWATLGIQLVQQFKNRR